MMATLVDTPPVGPEWVYEEKYDGYRLLAYKEGDRVTLLSRNSNDKTAAFASVRSMISVMAALTVSWP